MVLSKPMSKTHFILTVSNILTTNKLEHGNISYPEKTPTINY